MEEMYETTQTSVSQSAFGAERTRTGQGTATPAREVARWNPATSAYATDHLFAVIDDAPSAQNAARVLVASGYAQADVHVYSGEVQARVLEERENYSSVARFFRALQEAVTYDEQTTRTRYTRALRQGKTVLMVLCADDGRVQQAGDILSRAGGRHMVYYGRWNIQQVSPTVTVTTGEPR